jgi:hypothetical protein
MLWRRESNAVSMQYEMGFNLTVMRQDLGDSWPLLIMNYR